MKSCSSKVERSAMISETVVMMRRAPKPRAIDGRENILSKV